MDSQKSNLDSNTGRWFLITILIVALVFVARYLVISSIFVWNWQNPALHSALEAIGGMIAVTMAALLYQLSQGKAETKFSLLAIAFLGMGLLDIFHSLLPPGQSFVFLHSLAVFIGGVFFSLVWLNRIFKERLLSESGWPFFIAGGGATTIFVWGVFFPEAVPLMVSAGKFTSFAVILNFIGGITFLLGGAAFALDFLRFRKKDDYLFFFLAIMFGLAGILFKYSSLWNGEWWLWHFIRLGAYLIVLTFVVKNYRLATASLRQFSSQLEKEKEKLAESEKKFKLLTDFSPDCIKLIDKNRKIVYMNPGGLKEHNFKNLDEAIGWDFVDSIVDEQKEAAMGAFKSCLTEGKTISMDVNHKHGTADREWCNFSITPIKDDGQITGVLAISRDISKQKKAEEETKNRAEELERMNKLMTGREMININLKKEIEVLRQAQGKS